MAHGLVAIWIMIRIQSSIFWRNFRGVGHGLRNNQLDFGGDLGANYKKILRFSYDVIITYDNRKLLSHRKIILRFFVISPLDHNLDPGFLDHDPNPVVFLERILHLLS